jgi:ATP-dependent RNA helicase DeaD
MTVPGIEQFYLEVSQSSKLEVLSRLIDAHNIGLSLVFCNTKRQVDELTSSLQSRGYSTEALHGDMKQDQRNRVMSKFKKGQIDILIATDVAARGIDVDNVEAVFNYDLPSDEEYYVHRIGRTGRAGKTGKSYTFVVGREIHKLKEIQRYTKSTINLIKAPTPMDVEERKIGIILNKVKDILANGSYSKYVSHIEKVLEDVNPKDSDTTYVNTLEIAAALLKTIFDENNSQTTTKVETVIEEDSGSNDGMVRLFINVGRDSKVQPKHIVESIASCTSLPGKLIGAIDIFDRFTFVEVPKEYSGEVMDAMKNYTLKGKKIIIQRSNKKRAVKRSR